MRKIKVTDGLSININHAGLKAEGLTNVSISIPLDAVKYIKGINLIDCIKGGLLPDVTTKIDAITQELTAADLFLIRGWLVTGIIHTDNNPAYAPEQTYLLQEDDAIKGVVQFIDGETQPTYT
jgi:hypothetical protein